MLSTSSLASPLVARVAPALFRVAAVSKGSVLDLSRPYSTEDDSHDDFKPKVKAEPANPVFEQIEKDIADNKVFLYMKGIPAQPQCGFSNMAVKILDAYEVPFASRNVLADPEVREGIKSFSAWPTIPQLYVKGEFVGGSDIMMQMHQSGELEKLFDDVRQ